MLYVNESFDIGLGAKVTLVEIRNSKARLGIVAPKDLSVHRKEVWDALHASDGPFHDDAELA